MPNSLLEDAQALVERTRLTLHNRGLNRQSLASVREELIRLATHPELQNASAFPTVPEGQGRLYVLHEDDDGGYALYVNVCGPRVKSPPHDHTTWAVIAGVEGTELNTFYEQNADADLLARGELAVTTGKAIALMPDDIHSIDTRDEPRVVCLHFYGMALPKQTERRAFVGSDNTHYAPQPEIVNYR